MNANDLNTKLAHYESDPRFLRYIEQRYKRSLNKQNLISKEQVAKEIESLIRKYSYV